MCPVFPPFPACGAGKCVNGTCVCTYPFTQNVEFLHRDIAPNEIVFCDSLSFLVIIFSMLVSIMAAMLLVLYAKAIETRKQFIRASPGICGMLFCLITQIIRLSDVERPLIGIDYTYSFFFFNSAALVHVEIMIYIRRLTSYILKGFDVDARTVATAGVHKKLSPLAVILALLCYNLYASVALADDVETARKLALSACSLLAINHCYLYATSAVLLSQLIVDLTNLLKAADSSMSIEEVTVNETEAEKEKKRLQMLIYQAKVSRLAYLSSSGILAVFGIASCIFEGWRKQISIFYYIAFMLFQTFCVATLLSVASSNRHKRQLQITNFPLVSLRKFSPLQMCRKSTNIRG